MVDKIKINKEYYGRLYRTRSPWCFAFGWCGDLLGFSGVTFPITSSRFASMTHHYRTPTEHTLDTLEESVEQTVQWLDR